MKSTQLLTKSGIYFVIIMTIIPIILWLPFLSISTLPSLFLSLGQIFALSSVVLYSINFILATRLRFFEIFFGGLNRMYIIHHVVGAVAFVFILFHPLFIALSYACISIDAAATLLWPSFDNLPVWFGIAALLLTIILLFITLYVKIEYDLWKKTHKFLGLGFFLVSIHVFLTKSFLDSSFPLKLYIYFFILLAIFSFIYKTLLGRILVRRRKFVVSATREVAKDIWEISLVPVDKKPVFYHSGQFIFINPKVLGIANEEHPFSIVSKSSSTPLVIASKSVGNFTASLKLLSSGSTVLVEGPFGQFGWEYHPSEKQIWIAGGIGITPFVSMAKSLPKEGISVDLYYTVKDNSEAAYATELVNTVSENKNIRAFLQPSKQKGRLSADIIKHNSQHFSEATFFICGPPPMMKSMRDQLNKLSIKNRRIYSEEFSLN